MWLNVLLFVVGPGVLMWYLWSRRQHKLSLRVPRIDKKCVFITGCDSGFGHALALHLDSKGVPVFAGCLTEQGASTLREKCSSKLTAIPLDLTKTESIEAAFKMVSSNIPQGCELWGVVNNAGILDVEGPTEFYTRDHYRKLLEVNFLGMTDVNYFFLPLLKKSSGRIVNMSSISGEVPMPRYGAYSASKHAVVAYSNILRVEKSIWGIKVSIIEPGGYRTNIIDADNYRKSRDRQWNSLTPQIQQEYGRVGYDQETESMVEWHVRKAPTDLSPVVNAYEHALFAQYPKAHYRTDRQAKMLYLIHLLPWPLHDKLMKRAFMSKPMYIPQILAKKGMVN